MSPGEGPLSAKKRVLRAWNPIYAVFTQKINILNLHKYQYSTAGCSSCLTQLRLMIHFTPLRVNLSPRKCVVFCINRNNYFFMSDVPSVNVYLTFIRMIELLITIENIMCVYTDTTQCVCLC